MNFLNFLRNSNVSCECECEIVLCPVDIAFCRQKTRQRQVSKEVIERQVSQFQVPAYYEGWDSISVFCGARFSFNIFEKFGSTPHDNSHHTLSIEEHMRKAAHLCAEKTYEDFVIEAAALHDVGKLYTKVFCDKKGNPTSEAHFYSHENVGVYLYLLYAYSFDSMIKIEKYGAAKDDKRLDTAFLIQYHMRHYLCDEASMKKFYQKIGPKMACRLRLIERCDEEAH